MRGPATPHELAQVAGDIYREALLIGGTPLAFLETMLGETADEEAEALLDALTAISRSKEGERAARYRESSLARWRVAHPWMEPLAARIWQDRWRWRRADYYDERWVVETSHSPEQWRGGADSSWTLEAALYEPEPGATVRRRGARAELDARISGRPLGKSADVWGRTPEVLEDRYRLFLAAGDVEPRTKPGRALAYWRQLAAGGTVTVAAVERPVYHEEDIPF